MEKKAVKDIPCHGYHLILRENGRDANKNVDCYGCGKPVADLEIAYVCMQEQCSSNTIFHRKCGELSTEIRHPKHPHHPLHLVDFHLEEGHRCDVCRRDLDKVIGYRCFDCDFDADIRCEKIGIDALLEGERKQLKHPSHPDHPLTLMRKPATTFYCDGCGEEDEDMAYICSSCEFWVHKSCALLPFNRQVDHHHHHLSLVFSLPKEHRNYFKRCDICDKFLDRTSWVYFCGDCRYFVHLKCVGSTTKPDDSNIKDGSDAMIKFPLNANDISKELIRRFITREQGVDRISDDVKDMTSDHSFLDYHEHPLSLVLKEEEDDGGGKEEEDEDDEVKICEACLTPISSPPYYMCVSCYYFIHSICNSLPKTLCSSSLPHTAQLVKVYGECQGIPDKSHKFRLFAASKSIHKDVILYCCELCERYTNGMGYECEDCRMTIDVKCASLPPTITHAFHSHKSLLLTRKPPNHSHKECRACLDGMEVGQIAYCCMREDCDFTLHLVCAQLRKSVIKREWDKHPLLLLPDASLDHPSDFTCDFCESKIHPKAWMYHCRQCDVSFHEKCLETASGPYINFKFGRRFKMDDFHPHPLTFNYVTLKRWCDVCVRYIYSHTGFECVSCYYAMCRRCGTRSLIDIDTKDEDEDEDGDTEEDEEEGGQ